MFGRRFACYLQEAGRLPGNSHCSSEETVGTSALDHPDSHCCSLEVEADIAFVVALEVDQGQHCSSCRTRRA